MLNTSCSRNDNVTIRNTRQFLRPRQERVVGISSSARSSLTVPTFSIHPLYEWTGEKGAGNESEMGGETRARM